MSSSYTTSQETATTSSSTSSSSAISDSDSGDSTFSALSSFVGNTPSTVLFFLALAVGVFIASLFVFFTIRYFIRSKYGLHAYPVGQRSFIINTNLAPNLALMNYTDAELQEQLDYIRDHSFLRSDIMDRRLNLRRRRRRRRRSRYAKMKKLTEEEVETLFPRKTYKDWLNGGRERDVENREGMLQEEGKFSNKDMTRNSENENDHDGDNNDVERINDHDVDADADADADHDIELKDLPSSDLADDHLDDIPKELHYTSGTCAICLEVIEDDEIVRGLVCGHVFHADCLDTWLIKRRACCPMCKRDYYYKNGQNEQANTDQNNDDGNNNDIDGISNEAATTINDNESHNHHGSPIAGSNLDTATTEISNTITRTTSNERDGNSEDDDNDLDLQAFRADPILRSMLQELIPTDERVNMILSDESLTYLNLEAKGRETAKKKYSNIFKIIFWKIMGVSKKDLFNYGVLTFYHEFRVEEERQAIEESAQRLREVNNDTLNLNNNNIDNNNNNGNGNGNGNDDNPPTTGNDGNIISGTGILHDITSDDENQQSINNDNRSVYGPSSLESVQTANDHISRQASEITRLPSVHSNRSTDIISMVSSEARETIERRV